MREEKHTLSRDRPSLPLLRLHQRSALRLLRVLNNGSNQPRGPLHSLDLLLRLLFLRRLFLRLRFHSMFILKLTPRLNTHNLPALNPHHDITLAQDPLRMRNEHPRPHQLLFPLSFLSPLSLLSLPSLSPFTPPTPAATALRLCNAPPPGPITFLNTLCPTCASNAESESSRIVMGAL